MSPSVSSPIFNLPNPLKGLVLLIFLIHLPKQFGLDKLSNFLFQKLSFVPLRYWDKDFWWQDPISTLISPIGYTLIHADWVHLLVNLGMLIAFGKVVLDVCGKRGFWTIYVIGGLAGSLLVALIADYPQFPLVGASAAISGLVGAMTCLGIVQRKPMPRPFHSPKRSKQFLLVWIGLNLMMGVLPHTFFASSFEIAWQAHLAGFGAGFIYAWWGLRNFALNEPED